MTLALFLAMAQAQTAPPELTWATFDQVKSYAAPKPADLAFHQIDWQNTVAQGVNKAREADKPIVMWLFFGDPRGSC